MADKTHKVIVVGLPKTGTSTLAVMLRMLDYDVTGPDGDYTRNDDTYLQSKFQEFDAFQDYPWCFEWETFLEVPNVKFIVLKRDKMAWVKSFYKSYGRQQDRYMAFPFMQIKKDPENTQLFLDYFDVFYAKLDTFLQNDPDRFLSVDIESFGWKELCAFLKEPLPRTVFGAVVKKPHINKSNTSYKTSKTHQLKLLMRRSLVPVIGRKKWHALMSFMRKNKIYK